MSVLLVIVSCSQNFIDNKEVKLYLRDAVSKIKATEKTLVIEFWAPECGPCIRLKRDIFENEKTKELLTKNFYLVQVSPADSIYKKLWKHFQLFYQSTIIFIDKAGVEIDRTVSYDGNRDLYINFLNEVATKQKLFIDIYSTYLKDTADVTVNYQLARKYFFRYQLKDAVRQYEKVIALDKENKLGFNSESKYKIAECSLMQNGKLDKLKEYISEESDCKFARKAYEYLISELINKKDTLNCIMMCEEALSKHYDSWEILNKYAWAICTFKIKSDYQKALYMVQRSIELNPFRAGTYSTEAWIHYEMGNNAKAIELQNKAIEIYPNQTYVQDLNKFKTAL